MPRNPEKMHSLTSRLSSPFERIVENASSRQVRWAPVLSFLLIVNFALAVLATVIVRWLIG